VTLAPARRFPVLYQVNARTHLAEIARRAGRAVTLLDVEDNWVDQLAAWEVDWLYLLGVWQTGEAGREVSLSHPGIRQGCADSLPDLTDDDICGSCFAVTGYQVHERLGGDEALADLRARLAERGIRLMLDFVPNHTALDHPWVTAHPEHYVRGTDTDLSSTPENWTRVGRDGTVFAYGRDPYFAGWPDTLQLDYSLPALQEAMRAELLTAASRGDGLRCDMAMLLLPDVFARTWGRTMEPFWPTAIDSVRAQHPDFTFMAEVYWDREYDLQQQGFDFTYDKRLYDRLVGDLSGVRAHLWAAPDFQRRSARFLENHDEPRAAAVFGLGDRHRAAAVVTFLCPGLRFLQEGQFEGAHIHVSVHVCRAPDEPVDPGIGRFYEALRDVLRDPALQGDWQLLDTTAAWERNPSHHEIFVSAWSVDGELRFVVVANLADHWSQGYVPLPTGATEGSVTLVDRVGPARYTRDAAELAGRGLYLDLGPWSHHVFEVRAAAE